MVRVPSAAEPVLPNVLTKLGDARNDPIYHAYLSALVPGH